MADAPLRYVTVFMKGCTQVESLALLDAPEDSGRPVQTFLDDCGSAGRTLAGTGPRWALALVLSAPCLTAHDFWIEPSAYKAPVGTNVTIRFRVGEHFRGDPVARDPQRIIVFKQFIVKSETAVRGVPGADPAGVVRLGEPGLHLIAYHSTSSPIELEAGEFESYLRQEGLERIIDERTRRGERDAKGRELFARCVKSLLSAGESDQAAGFDRVLGFPVELVPDEDPYEFKLGEELPVRMLREGRPLTGMLVVGYPYGDPASAVRGRTGKDGRVRLKLEQAGPWLIKAVHMERIEDDRAQWQSWWASLTFELPGK